MPPFVESSWRDVRDGTRLFLLNPAFTLIAFRWFTRGNSRNEDCREGSLLLRQPRRSLIELYLSPGDWVRNGMKFYLRDGDASDWSSASSTVGVIAVVVSGY